MNDLSNQNQPLKNISKLALSKFLEIMKTLIVNLAILYWLSLLLLLISSRTVNGTGEGGFSYDPCSATGPDHWGELKKEWEMCKIGNIQSPISLSKWTADSTKSLGDLRRDHKPTNAILKNDGHALVVEWKGNGGSIKINNINYPLVNYHWHHPSEHTQDGKTYPLELHMVHISNKPNVTNSITVVAVLFEYGPRDPFIFQIEREIQLLNIEGGEKNLGRKDPRVAKLAGKKYFRYIGSLTTPPCTEGVIWTVMEKVQTVAPYQIELMKEALVEEKNARPLQEINGRDVFYYDPLPWSAAK